jgi:hypothetical protein
MSENPDAKVRLLFKTVARMARFHNGTERGLAAGIERALELQLPTLPPVLIGIAGLRGALCSVG